MATNYFKQAYDELKSIIQTAYPRFNDKDRISFVLPVDDEIEVNKANFGYEDCIFIVPGEPTEETQILLTSGEIVVYNLKLYYYKILKENELNDLSATAENITALLMDNKDQSSGYWINLGYDVIYSIPKPEEWTGRLHGFTIDIHFQVGKFP